jgi:hypothetical protein
VIELPFSGSDYRGFRLVGQGKAEDDHVRRLFRLACLAIAHVSKS